MQHTWLPLTYGRIGNLKRNIDMGNNNYFAYSKCHIYVQYMWVAITSIERMENAALNITQSR